MALSACSWNQQQAPIEQGSQQAQKDSLKGRWYCKGGDNEQWHCNDLSKPERPVLSTSATAPKPRPAAPSTNTEKAAADQPGLIPRTATQITTTAPVRTEQPPSNTHTATADYPDHFVVVQLIAAKQQDTIDNFRARYPQQSFIEATTLKDNEQWAVLLLGVYPDRESAKQAVLTAGFELDNVWIRPAQDMERTEP